jgi:phosphatidylinositol 4-kinase B
MGGRGSKLYNQFGDLFHKGMNAIRQRADELSLVLEIMMEDSDLECFRNFNLPDFMGQFKRHYSE